MAMQLDRTDRTILRLLSEDATVSNARIGEIVSLSAPAIHERLKRLKGEGVIRSITANIDAAKVGRAVLSFILLKTKGISKKNQVNKLSDINEIEAIYSIAGEFSLLLKVRTEDTAAMEEIYEQIYAIEGVESSQTIIAFKSFLERGTHVNES
ncbi:MAG: Lrp/AsnC family transcriptional regulator [Inquilinaceae bacterium]